MDKKLMKMQMDGDGDLPIVVSSFFAYACHPGADTVTVESTLNRARK